MMERASGSPGSSRFTTNWFAFSTNCSIQPGVDEASLFVFSQTARSESSRRLRSARLFIPSSSASGFVDRTMVALCPCWSCKRKTPARRWSSLVEAAILLKRQKIIAVPVVPRFDGGFAAGKVERSGSVKRRDLEAMLDVFDLHLPIACARRGMVVAVVNERFAFKFQGAARPDEGVLHKCG